MFQMQRLDHVALVVRNLDRSVSWYQDMLGMEQRQHYRDLDGNGSPVVICSGDGCLALFPSSPDQPIPVPLGHVAFRLDRANFDEARAHLRDQGIDARYVEYKTMHSLYFPDPDGYEIEISTYDIERRGAGR